MALLLVWDWKCLVAETANLSNLYVRYNNIRLLNLLLLQWNDNAPVRRKNKQKLLGSKPTE